jgi:hypothetical protein
MATERLLMRHIREILRSKWTLGRTHRDTTGVWGSSAGAVASVLTRATALTWEAVAALSDDVVERRLYGPRLALHVAGRRVAPRAQRSARPPHDHPDTCPRRTARIEWGPHA